MAKTKAPLFSLHAHGGIGNVLTYARRMLKDIARFQRPQKDYENAARKTQRDYFRTAVQRWRTLSAADKEAWNVFVE